MPDQDSIPALPVTSGPSAGSLSDHAAHLVIQQAKGTDGSWLDQNFMYEALPFVVGAVQVEGEAEVGAVMLLTCGHAKRAYATNHEAIGRFQGVPFHCRLCEASK